jgi:hypothetical protein
MTTTYSDPQLSELRGHIDAMLEVVATGGWQIREHLEWEACQMVTRLSPDDLTTPKLAGLIAVLHAAHARAITPPTGDRPILRIVPNALEIGSEI